MTATVLIAIKQDIKKLSNLFRPIAEHWTSSSHLITMSALLQDMCFNNLNCEGYSHKKEVEKLYALLYIFKEFVTYYDSHIENWIYDELTTIIQGNLYAE